MGKFSKILIAAALFALICVLGLSLTVKFFLTDEKIKALVIPPAEKALGRKVTIGDIKVGLLSGIKINKFSVREENGTDSFLTSQAFIMQYSLMSILNKELLVSEIVLDSPEIHISRNKEGIFNFSSLAVLKKDKAEKGVKQETKAAESAALPLALTVDQVRVANAKLVFTDEKKELPDVDMKADLTVGLQIASDLASLTYNGKLMLSGDAVLGQIKPHAELTADFDKNVLKYKLEVAVGEEKIFLRGQVADYSASPDIILNIDSPSLNLQYLAALGTGLPKSANAPREDEKIVKKQKVEKTDREKPVAIAESLPKALKLNGKIDIKKAVYNKLAIENFNAAFSLEKGILKIIDLTAMAAGGRLRTNLEMDLNKPGAVYNGKISAESLSVSEFGKGLELSFAEVVSGNLKAAIDFSGKGLEPETIKKNINGKASYSVTEGLIKNNKMTDEIAAILMVPELKTIRFNDVAGDAEILEGGKIKIDNNLKNNDFSIKTSGSLDLDGNLKLPMIVNISPQMMSKIDKGGSITNFIANDKGENIVHLNVGGTFQEPKVALDKSYMKKKVQKAVADQVLKSLEKVIGNDSAGNSSQNDPAKGVINIMKGFLGN